MENNANYVVTSWRVTLYRDKWNGNDYDLMTVFGTFVDLLIKLKFAMDSEEYNSFVIENMGR